MKKRLLFKLIIIVLISLLLKEVILLIYCNNQNKLEVKSYYNNETSFNYKSDLVINIPKINLDAVIKKASDDFNNLDKNLVYYKNNNYKKKIIIFGHSGMGYGAYFNRLDELEKNDIVYLYKDKLKITYTVDKIYSISSSQTDVLNDDRNYSLFLITCKKNEKNMRLVVQLGLKSVQTLKK